ncbi:MAG: T9SS type A sorting domain-containing protein [Ferruginibacter sp.]
MKHLITALFLLTTCMAKSQIVNITSPDLKNELLNYTPAIDTNGDGEIQVSEALAVHRLYLQGGVSDDLTGLEAFTNVDTLTLYTWPLHLTHINLSGWTKLRRLEIDSHYLESVNLSGCSNLGYLAINAYTPTPYAHITSLDISGTPRLKELICNGIHTAELDLRQEDSLVNFASVWQNNIGVINISGLQMCEKLSVAGPIGLINAENAIALKGIYFGTGSNQDIETVDSINVHGCTNLISLNIGTNYTASAIDISTCPNLIGLYGSSNTITSLDFSNCHGFRSITGNFQNLHTLNLKNGHKDPYIAIKSLTSPTQPLYVCTDDFERAYIDSTLHTKGWSELTTTVNPFCSSISNGGAYNTISGIVRIDRNHDGCDITDSGLPNVGVKVTNALGSSTVMYSYNPSGTYKYYDTTGSFTVKPYFPYPYYSVSPVSANVVFDTINNITDVNDFCITSTGSHNLLDITVVPLRRPAPGFEMRSKIYYRNTGTTVLSGNVQLNFDNNKLIFVTAYSLPIPSTQLPGQLSWSYSNLQPFETRVIDVYFHVAEMPVNNIGDTLLMLATINPVSGDETPSNNSFILLQKVLASADPNYKQCLEGEKLNIENTGDNLDYVIHFQNLGTDTAFNVVVTDTLSNNLDWESFDIIGTSHPCEIKRKDNKLQFYFNDIHLPYAAINEQASQGYVVFKIKPKNSVVIGDSLNNRASIYFDFNPAIVTNLATTVVVPTVSLAVKLEYFSLVNKNETNQLVWKASSTTGITDFAIEKSNDGIHFTNIGNITATVERCQSPFNFTDEKPFDGKTYYRINIKDANGISFYSKVLVAERTKSGLSIITAVVSNQNNTTLYLNASKEQNVQMKVIAADGRMVYNQTKIIAAGSSTLNLQVKNLATGIYTLIVYTNNGEVITKRFLK